MAFEIRKISDVGTSHPVVARLGPQTAELVQWIDLTKANREALVELYTRTLSPRLLRCHENREELVNKIVNSAERIQEQKDSRVREIPHVIGLDGIVESFLYEAKNYLRDLLGLFQIVYGCELKDASAFTDLKGVGDSNLVKWAAATLGANHHLTELLKTEQGWTAKLIRMRNALEHPGGLSGTMTIENIVALPDGYVPPTWSRTGEPKSDVVGDMDAALDNMLTLAEDLLIHATKDKSIFKDIAFYEIPIERRNLHCPIRFSVGPSPEFQAKIGMSSPQSGA
ncbi:hypothetical protein AB4Z01_23455 [Inquilinus sp. YAF38]|uniref:hypothetical protein n=1 Tax=Inquilinus sp. YAF38 TaxID=3233084 RepID=UPI003F923E70